MKRRSAVEDKSGEDHTTRPFYGRRRKVVFLRGSGHVVNRKWVQRLTRGMGWQHGAGAEYEQAHPKHKVYPDLLRAYQ